jgi:hypothetical protein
MDVVLGVSMSPSTIRTVLVEGENADCVTVDAVDESVTAAADRVATAVLGARECADEAGDQMCSTGVTWTDEVEVAQLREALAERKIDNVMLISAFLAAAALAQAVGQAIGYGRIAMLFVEPECATLAVVDAADGSITDVHKELMHSADATAELVEMVAGLESLETCPAGLFVVGSGVDIAPIKSRLETETSLAVTAPDEPETALARGAALASANAPLFASSTAALAYAQDPGTGEVDFDAVAPGHFYLPDAPSGGDPGEEELAYSAVPDEEADALTDLMDTAEGDSPNEGEQRRRPVLLLGSAGAVVAISAVLAMEVALALGIRPGVALRPSPGQNLIVPTEQSPAPAAPRPRNISHPGAVAVPHPLNPPAPVAPPPAAAVPAPIPAAPPVPVPVLVVPPAVPAPDSPPPPLNLRAPQPPTQVPASPPTQVPVSPPTHVPVSQPPTHVPVSHPPVHVPVPPPPAHVPEPQPPVNVPAPDAPPAPGHPGHEAPPVLGLPGLEPPPAPGLPGHVAPPAPDTPPARGDESGPGAGLGGEVGGHGSGGGANEGGAGTGGHGSSPGGEIGGGSSGGGSIGGSTEIGGGSSAGSSSAGSSSGSSSSGGGQVGGGSGAGSSTGESGGGGHH